MVKVSGSIFIAYQLKLILGAEEQMNSNSMDIIISFIIPMYKGKDYILECVSHIKRVNYPKEILIINDGSPDDSFSYCERTFREDDEVILLTKQNGGVASARNYGLQFAKGNYLVFVDQDDVLVPEVVSKATDIMELTGSNILFWDTDYLLNAGQLLPNTHSLYELSVNRKDIIEKILPHFLFKKETELQCELGPLWGAIFSREFIRDNNICFKFFTDYEDDHLFLADALMCADNVYFLPEVGYYWRIRNNSTSHKRKKTTNYVNKTLRSNLYRMNQYKRICNNTEMLDEYETYIEQRVILHAININCTYYNWNWSEIREIRKLLYKDKFITAFTDHELIDRNRYTVVIYTLIKKRLDYIAFFMAYLNSLRFCMNDK